MKSKSQFEKTKKNQHYGSNIATTFSKDMRVGGLSIDTSFLEIGRKKPNAIHFHKTCYYQTRVLGQQAKQDAGILNKQQKNLGGANKANNL